MAVQWPSTKLDPNLGTVIMESNSSTDRNKTGKPEETASSKLDFLLDTVDNEVADLADVVDTTEPVVADVTPNEKTKAASVHDQKEAADSLELDIDLFGDSDDNPSEKEPEERQAQDALDAMNDAEGEVEAMLAKEEQASDDGADVAATVSNNPVGQDIAKELDVLLSTREVDASRLLQKMPKPERQPAEKPAVSRDQLTEDLFHDLEAEFAAEETDAGEDKPIVSEKDLAKDLAKDLLEELKEDTRSRTEDTGATETVPIEDKLAEDLFDESDLQGEGTADNTTPAGPLSGGDEELADLLSKKIEALVTRMVEERLSGIAERVIMEKINKIFSSMK